MIISFSGIDGAGKSFYSNAITLLLNEKGYKAESTSPEYLVNDIMKDFCENRFGDRYSYIPNLNSTMYVNGLMLDWIDLLEKKLKFHESSILICDRYVYDVLAQAIHYGADIKPIVDLFPFFPKPDISFYISITPELAYNRLKLRKSPPIHLLESNANLHILDSAYRQIKSLIHWDTYLINADDSIDSIIETIIPKL